MVIVVNTIKGDLGPCWPIEETFNYVPDPAARGIAVFLMTITGTLNPTVGMEFGSGNFMDLQESVTLGSDAHVEVWTLAFPGPANPTTIKFLANGSNLTGATFGIVEVSGNDPDRDLMVGFIGSSSGANSVEISTPWTAENVRSLMLDAFSMKGKSKMTQGSGQTKLWMKLTSLGKAAGSSEPATGFGPAVWTIGVVNPRRYAHVVLEIKEAEVVRNGTMDAQTGPATLDGTGDVERDGTFDPVVGAPASFTGTGTLERNGVMDRRTEPATFTGLGNVPRDGTMDRRTDPATFIGFGNNNTDHFGGMRSRARAAQLDGVGDVEHSGTMDVRTAAAGLTGVGNTDKTGTMSAQAGITSLDGVGGVEHSGVLDKQTEVATVNFKGDVEHDGAMDEQTAAATMRATGNKGSVLVGFDVASRNFVVTIDSQYTGIRAQIMKSGASSTIYVPVSGNSVIIRKLT